jgi:three-Cys-motif partner protein
MTHRSSHKFGGAWTEEKLRVLNGYLSAYTTALSKTPFSKGYIDAFAGSGYRDGPDQGWMFPDLGEEEPQTLLDGSARLALKVEPPFDGFVFIEQHAGRRKELEALGAEFPQFQGKIRIHGGDANKVLRALCRMDWSQRRAVLFLDPYGLEVEWTTIAAVASTHAIDMWLLFPLGIGVNRLLPKSGEIPEAWRNRLTALLGTDDWFDEFYSKEIVTDLFGDEQVQLTKRSQETIGRYFIRRLESVFAGVSQKPRVLSNSRGCPLYLLCFAAGNPNGAPIAIRIADHLLTRLE